MANSARLRLAPRCRTSPSSPSTPKDPPQARPTRPSPAPGSSSDAPPIQLAVSVMPYMLKTRVVPTQRPISFQNSSDSGAEPTWTRARGRFGPSDMRMAIFQNDGTELMKVIFSRSMKSDRPRSSATSGLVQTCNAPPAESAVKQLPIRPWPKKAGSTLSVRARSAEPMASMFSARRAESERRLCTTPFGVPVVPDVISISAGTSRPSARPARMLKSAWPSGSSFRLSGVSQATGPSQSFAPVEASTRLCSSGVSFGLTATATAPAVQAANTSRMNVSAFRLADDYGIAALDAARGQERGADRRRFSIWRHANSAWPERTSMSCVVSGRPATMAGSRAAVETSVNGLSGFQARCL